MQHVLSALVRVRAKATLKNKMIGVSGNSRLQTLSDKFHALLHLRS